MVPFGEAHAAVYDRQFEKISTVRDVVHLGARLGLDSLPEKARILCVGAGTGEDALRLGEVHPNWHFQLTDPAPAMLAIARQRLEAAGLLDRCSFHDGFLDSLPQSAPFDGATALLVSHFLTSLDERTQFFRDIAGRLAPGGTLVCADLAADRAAPDFRSVMDLWLAGLRLCDLPAENLASYDDAFGRDFAAHRPAQLEQAITDAGFTPPVQAFQALLIRVYVARRLQAGLTA